MSKEEEYTYRPQSLMVWHRIKRYIASRQLAEFFIRFGLIIFALILLLLGAGIKILAAWLHF
jgi:hypothetical protein